MNAPFFYAAVELILRHEGGFVDDPKDPGGATKYGISNRSHPVDRDGDGDIDADDAKLITVEEARNIYYENYWLPLRCNEYNWSIALCTFDSAVNQGCSAAIKMLQKAAGVTVDGDFGQKTLSAVQRIGAERLVRDFQSLRIERYCGLVIKRPDMSKFLYGWIRRTMETTIEATKYLD